MSLLKLPARNGRSPTSGLEGVEPKQGLEGCKCKEGVALCSYHSKGFVFMWPFSKVLRWLFHMSSKKNLFSVAKGNVPSHYLSWCRNRFVCQGQKPYVHLCLLRRKYAGVMCSARTRVLMNYGHIKIFCYAKGEPLHTLGNSSV